MGSKTVIVTGASRGIGQAIGEDLKEHKLVLCARDEKKLNEIILQIKQNGGDAIAVKCDVTNEEDVKNVVNTAIDTYGKLDVLINNAGIGQFKRVDEFSRDEFEHIMNVNLFGTFLFTKYSVPHMINQKSGQIINIASVAALNGFKTGTAYAASKFAMLGFSESLREDVKDYGIAVTTVCPGSVRTEFGGIELPSKDKNPFSLEPEDVARTVRYLVEESETANAKLIELKPRKKIEFR